MGTTFTIKYSKSILSVDQLKSDINHILNSINKEMSTYDKKSEISTFNNIKANIPYKISPDFYYVLEKSYYYYDISDGLFDITIDKLSSLWGFDEENFIYPSKDKIENTLNIIGFDKIQLSDDNMILKMNDDIRANLNAIAKGYAVDKLSNYLDINSIENYMIEIGGEVKVKGRNPDGEKWIIGLSDFTLNTGSIIKSISIENNSMATSGDYRNFIVYNNKTYSHIINPKTGYPAKNKVVSATVISKNCIDADALATLLNVMPINQSIDFINTLDSVECLIVERDKDKFNYYYSNNMNQYIN